MSSGYIQLPVQTSGGGITELTGDVLAGPGSGSQVATVVKIDLPVTDGTVGIIFQDGNPLLNTFGTSNLFLGPNSGNFTLTGGFNVGIGESSLHALTTGNGNMMIGYECGFSLTSDVGNVAVGQGTFSGTTPGTSNNNTSIGTNCASVYSVYNTCTMIGFQSAGTEGLASELTDCTFIGANTDSSNSSSSFLTNQTAIGAGALVNDDNSIQLGNTDVVYVNTSGQVRSASIGVGNSEDATLPGAVVKKIEIFDNTGASLGFVAVYSSIT